MTKKKKVMQGPILVWSMWSVAQTILANIKISTHKNTLAYYLFVTNEEKKVMQGPVFEWSMWNVAQTILPIIKF
jgi:hypothetical protein